MLISITSDQVYDWHPNQKVFVYSGEKKCLELCRVMDLDLCLGDRTRLLEPLTKIFSFANHKKENYPPLASEVESVPTRKPVIGSRRISRIMNAVSRLLKKPNKLDNGQKD